MERNVPARGAATVIREATSRDLKAVQACARDAWKTHAPMIGMEHVSVLADFTTLIREGRVFLTESPEQGILGFAVFMPQGDHMFLDNLAVRRSARGLGLGRAFVEFCEASARNAGLTAVELVTNQQLDGNVALYRHLGYAETRRFLTDRYAGVRFRKELQPG